MAAPSSKDASNMAGTWHLNRVLSNDPDKIFALQDVPWLVRKVLKYANLTLEISQSTSTSNGTNGDASNGSAGSPDHSSVTTLHIKQTVNPGGFNSEGTYPINGKTQDLSLPIFGDVNMTLRYINVEDIPDETLRQKMAEANPSKTVIDEAAHNASKGWKAEVIWGFEIVNGERYLTRNIKTWNDKETLTTRMVYDYKS